MLRSKIFQLKNNLGKAVLVKAWLHEIRDQSKIKFLILRDDSGVVQAVLKNDSPFFGNDLNKETVLAVTGEVKQANITNPEVTEKTVEILVKDLKVLAGSEPELPIQVVENKAKAELPTRLNWRCLDLRKPSNHAIFKIQSMLIQGMQKYLNSEGFIQVFTPCLMGVPSESGSEMFEVKYFDTKAYLRQDPQLHRQLTIASGIERLYDIGPSWRAELSHTTKHLCEHRVCAVELAFIEDEHDVMKVEENVIVSALKNVNETCKHELDLLGIKLNVPNKPFPVLEFPEVYDILERLGKNVRGEDLDTEAEKLLWDYVKKEYGVEFYFVNKFPYKIKPFYVMKYDDSEYARSTDLYWRGLELSSGGQRENRYDVLMRQVKDKGINEKSVEWFTKFFKYGVPPHGGFAIGIERITQALLNLSNIREAVLFPRDTERLTP